MTTIPFRLVVVETARGIYNAVSKALTVSFIYCNATLRSLILTAASIHFLLEWLATIPPILVPREPVNDSLVWYATRTRLTVVSVILSFVPKG